MLLNRGEYGSLCVLQNCPTLSACSSPCRSPSTTSRRPDAAHKTAVIDPATLSIGPVLTLAEAKSGALLDRLEVVTRRDLTDDVRGEGSSLGRLAEIPHVILPPRRGVEVEEANRPVARVAEGVGHAGRHADERAGADLMRVVAQSHRQHAVEHVEHVVQVVVAVRRWPGEPGI